MSWIMAAVSIGAGVGVAGTQAQAEQQKGQMEAQKTQLAIEGEFAEAQADVQKEKLGINFAKQWGERLQAYNTFRNQQITAIGYQGRTIDSVSNIQKSDRERLEFDRKMQDIHRSLETKALDIQSMQAQLGIQAEQRGLDDAQKATQTAANWQMASQAVQAGTSYARYTENKE